MAFGARSAVNLTIAVILCAPTPFARADDRPPPGRTRAVAVAKTSTAPVIDGRLDDGVWSTAGVADRFFVSEQERRPTEETEALVAADGEFLYVAFRCYDRVPDAIEALQTRRDAGMARDDHVVVQLDPYHNHRNFFTFYVNARGTQDDYSSAGRARRTSRADDWKAAAVGTDYGWSAELAIPFRILNYRNQTRVFGVNFVRYHHRTDEWSRWADWTPQTKPEEMGHLLEMDPPSRSDLPWRFVPFALLAREADADGNGGDILWRAGLDVRYAPAPHMTGVLAITPDFSQVERQVTDIDFNYNEKFRADIRPFFQEGAAYVARSSTYFYSNRVPDFRYGGKFFAQLDRWQVGALATIAADQRRDMVARVAREFNPTHSLDLTLVGTDRADLRNEVVAFSFDGRQRSGFNYRIDGAMSRTQRARSGDGERARVAMGWSGNHWSFGVNTDWHDRNFNPANGLVRRDLLGTWGASSSAGYYRDLARGPFRTLTFSTALSRRDTIEGLMQTRAAYGSAAAELRSQIRIGFSYSDSDYRPALGQQTWSSTINPDRYWTARLDFNTRATRFGYGLAYSSGFLNRGDYAYGQVYLWLRPAPTIFINISPEVLRSFGRDDRTIVSGGWDVTPENSLLGRYIAANGKHWIRFAYRRQVRAGFNLFAVSDSEPDQRPTLSLKLIVSFP